MRARRSTAACRTSPTPQVRRPWAPLVAVRCLTFRATSPEMGDAAPTVVLDNYGEVTGTDIEGNVYGDPGALVNAGVDATPNENPAMEADPEDPNATPERLRRGCRRFQLVAARPSLAGRRHFRGRGADAGAARPHDGPGPHGPAREHGRVRLRRERRHDGTRGRHPQRRCARAWPRHQRPATRGSTARDRECFWRAEDRHREDVGGRPVEAQRTDRVVHDERGRVAASRRSGGEDGGGATTPIEARQRCARRRDDAVRQGHGPERACRHARSSGYDTGTRTTRPICSSTTTPTRTARSWSVYRTPDGERYRVPMGA